MAHFETLDDLVQQRDDARNQLHDVLGQLARARAERDESRRTQVQLMFMRPSPTGQRCAHIAGDGLDGEEAKFMAWCPYDVAHIWWGPETALHLFGARPGQAKRPQRSVG